VMFEYFSKKSIKKIQVSLKPEINKEHFR